jgi:ubiquinol-cytochrome c reductase cytochrome c subunit
VLALLLGLLAAVYSSFAPRSEAQDASADADLIRLGRSLYLTSCSTCHGLNAQGSSVAPNLIGVGAAAVDFQVSSGRMPLQQQNAEAERKPPKFKPNEIRALAAYVASLAPGPAIPTDDMVDPRKGNPAKGGELFRANCAQCHNFNGSGGALTYGKYAPSLYPATPKQIYEAMLHGPENMPVFGDGQLSPKEKRDIIAFLKDTHRQPDPGGFGLGRLGPVPEGTVAWVVGTVALVLVTIWMGARI